MTTAAGIAYRLGFAGFEEGLLTAPDPNTTTTVIGTAGRIADRFNPITGGPSAPLKTEALFGAYAPSLMPRAALHQGIAAGATVLAAEAVGRGIANTTEDH